MNYNYHMNRIIHLCWILGFGLCSGLSAEAIKSSQVNPEAGCGQDIRMKDVLVLDLEPFRGHPEMAQDFVDKYAGEFRLVYSEPEEIRTRSRPSKEVSSALSQAVSKMLLSQPVGLEFVIFTWIQRRAQDWLHVESGLSWPSSLFRS